MVGCAMLVHALCASPGADEISTHCDREREREMWVTYGRDCGKLLQLIWRHFTFEYSTYWDLVLP